MRRHGLSLRRKTTVAQKDPEQLIDKLVAYVLQDRILSNVLAINLALLLQWMKLQFGQI